MDKGFTLIETLVYLALLGLLFGVLLTAGFAIVENLDALKLRANVQEEGNFIVAKINWVVLGSTEFVHPLAGYGGLEFENETVRLSVNPDIGDSANGGYFYYQQDKSDHSPGEKINSRAVRITLCDGMSQIFFHAGGLNQPESLEACFKVVATTITAKTIVQQFRITNYRHK